MPKQTTTYIFKIGEDEVEVGDKEAIDFKPSIKLKKWGEECFLKVEYPTIKTILPAEQHSKVKWIDTDKELHFYPLEKKIYDEGTLQEVIQNELGGFEFEIILKKKPKSNKIVLNIATQGLDFFYQPELTPEEIAEGAYRPENVVGSYAVYHENKQGNYEALGGKNYRAGKAFHIYRPKIIDNAGKEVWGLLNINEHTGLLTIEISQEFLDNAVYPVKIDPNFGYETIGGSSYGWQEDYLAGSLFTGAVGKGVSITAYNGTTNGTNKTKYALYKHSDSTKVTNGETAEMTIPNSWAWRTLNFGTAPTLEAIDYVITEGFEAGADPDQTWVAYDVGDTDQGHYEAITYPTFPATASFGHNTTKYSIYCTYTPIYNMSCSDILDGVESGTAQLVIGCSCSDVMDGVDSQLANAIFIRSSSDIVSLVDNANAFRELLSTVTDIMDGVDTNSITLTFARSASDTLEGVDSNLSKIIFNRTAADILKGVDMPSISLTITLSVSDIAEMVDSSNIFLATLNTCLDILEGVDTTNIQITFAGTAIDIMEQSDSGTAQVTLTITAEDVLSGVESVSSNLEVIRNALDVLAGVDSVLAKVIFATSAVDIAEVTDSETLSLVITLSSSDIMKLVDSTTTGEVEAIILSCLDIMELSDLPLWGKLPKIIFETKGKKLVMTVQKTDEVFKAQ